MAPDKTTAIGTHYFDNYIPYKSTTSYGPCRLYVWANDSWEIYQINSLGNELPNYIAGGSNYSTIAANDPNLPEFTTTGNPTNGSANEYNATAYGDRDSTNTEIPLVTTTEIQPSNEYSILSSDSFTIGNVSFKAVEVIDLESKFLIPEHTLEDQFTVQDHIFELPVNYNVTLSLDRDLNEHLTFTNLLSKNNTLYRVVTPLKVVELMAIGSSKLQMSDSENIIYASFTLTEIRTAKVTFTQGSGINYDLAKQPSKETDTDKKTTTNTPDPVIPGDSAWYRSPHSTRYIVPAEPTMTLSLNPSTGLTSTTITPSIGNLIPNLGTNLLWEFFRK